MFVQKLEAELLKTLIREKRVLEDVISIRSKLSYKLLSERRYGKEAEGNNVLLIYYNQLKKSCCKRISELEGKNKVIAYG